MTRLGQWEEMLKKEGWVNDKPDVRLHIWTGVMTEFSCILIDG